MFPSITMIRVQLKGELSFMQAKEEEEPIQEIACNSLLSRNVTIMKSLTEHPHIKALVSGQ